MNWWRAYHGLPYDSKLAVVARRCEARRGDVTAIWVAVLDFASQNEERGSTEGIDAEEIAVSLDYEVEHVRQILRCFEEKGMIADGRLTAWERRQVQRERDDDSKERVREYRKRQKQQESSLSRHVTPCNAPDKNREEQNRAEERKTDAPSALVLRDLPAWKRDEQFVRFTVDYLGTGGAFIDKDFSDAFHFCWKTLDLGQKLERVAALNRHSEEYHSDPRFVPKPLKFLQDEWQRPVKPPPAANRPNGKQASLADRAIALMGERIARGESPL